MLEQMMEGMSEGSESPELSVLKEIKQLMDSRLGDKLKGAVSDSEVEAEPAVEVGESEEGANLDQVGSESSLSPEEEEELNQIRSKMV